MSRPYYTYGDYLLGREAYTSTVYSPYADLSGSNIRRYFSSIDTDVYFGDLLIDEMVAFDFIIDEKKMPIYGYNNFVAKRLITGQKTIQGSFAINFTRTFNMQEILESEAVGTSIYANDYDTAQFFCADDNKSIFDKGFDITLSYGEGKGEGSYNSCTQTLVGCHITSYRQAFDTSGEPILDMYTFIAKDLVLNTEIFEPKEEEVKDPYSEDTPTRPDPTTPDEIWKVANTSITKEFDDLFAYWQEHPNTLCVCVNPLFDYLEDEGVSRLSINIQPLNKIELLIDSITIDISDRNLSGSYSFTMDSRINTYDFYYDMTGTNVKVGKEIKKLFANGEVSSLDCIVYIKCNDRETTYSLEHATSLHSPEYSPES